MPRSPAGERLLALLRDTTRWPAPGGGGLHRGPAACMRSGHDARSRPRSSPAFWVRARPAWSAIWSSNAGGRRLALLINEFGDLGVDRALLGGCGIEGCAEEDVIELANGCICCTVADDFLPAMRTILARDPAPDHIVIETSGLALPKPLVAAFNWPEVRSRLTVDGVLVVADAEPRCSPAASPTTPTPSRPSAPPTPRSTTRPRSRSCSRSSSAAATWCWSTRPIRSTPRERRRGRGRDPRRAAPRRAAGLDQPRPDRPRRGAGPGRRLPRTTSPTAPRTMTAARSTATTSSRASSLPVPPLADPSRWCDRLRAAIRGHDILRVKGFLAVTGQADAPRRAGGRRAHRPLLRPTLARRTRGERASWW